MKKSGADDISNLFKQFGGQADRYQEISQANEARLSRERWPLLNAIGAEHTPPPASTMAATAAPLVEPPPQAPAAEPARTMPRPLLSALRAETQQAPTLPAAQPTAPLRTVLQASYTLPETEASKEQALTPQQEPHVPPLSLSQLFSKLESAATPPELDTRSTSSLFKRLSRL